MIPWLARQEVYGDQLHDLAQLSITLFASIFGLPTNHKVSFLVIVQKW